MADVEDIEKPDTEEEEGSDEGEDSEESAPSKPAAVKGAKFLSETKNSFTWQTPEGTKITTLKAASPRTYMALSGKSPEEAAGSLLAAADEDDERAPAVMPQQLEIAGGDMPMGAPTDRDQDAAYVKQMLNKGLTPKEVEAALLAQKSPGGMTEDNINKQYQAAVGKPPATVAAPAPGPTAAPGDHGTPAAAPAAAQTAPNAGGAPAPAAVYNPAGNLVMQAAGGKDVVAGAGRQAADAPDTPQQDPQQNYMIVPSSGESNTSSGPTAEQQGAITDFSNYGSQAIEDTRRAQDAEQQLKMVEAGQKWMDLTDRYETTVMREQTAQADTEKMMASLHTDIIDRGKMGLNQNRLFGDGQTGNKIIAAISLALGGIGGAMAGRDFNVMGIIQKAIDRDIEVQKLNIGAKDTSISNKQTEIQRALEVAKDRRVADDVVTAQQLTATASYIDQLRQSPLYADPAKKKLLDDYALNIAHMRDSMIMSAQGQVHSKKKEEAGQLFKSPEQTDQERLQGNGQQLNMLDHIEALTKARDGIRTGKIPQWLRDMATKGGFQNPSTADFNNLIQTTMAGVIDRYAGARGWAQTELPNLRKLALDPAANPQAFSRQVQTLRGQIQADISSTEARLDKSPMVTRGYAHGKDYYEAARKSYPVNYFDKAAGK